MNPPATDYCPACGTRNRHIEHDGRLRPICPACGHITYVDAKTAVVTMLLHDDHVLLVQRRYDPGCGKWGLPGGFAEYGEDPRETARREVAEETGLIARITDLLDVFFVENGVITIGYRGIVTGGDLHAEDDAEAAAWFPREALPELVFLSTVSLCQRWQRGEIS
ncbi:MAG: NUDIX domain-containing protein [Chloroflexota bacterium]